MLNFIFISSFCQKNLNYLSETNPTAPTATVTSVVNPANSLQTLSGTIANVIDNTPTAIILNAYNGAATDTLTLNLNAFCTVDSITVYTTSTNGSSQVKVYDSTSSYIISDLTYPTDNGQKKYIVNKNIIKVTIVFSVTNGCYLTINEVTPWGKVKENVMSSLKVLGNANIFGNLNVTNTITAQTFSGTTFQNS